MISVIIPVYNAQPYLARCIDSVRNSPCSSLEILLVNDGSTDDSPRICSRYAAEDRRIRFITQQNQGVSAARNRGIREARGECMSPERPPQTHRHPAGTRKIQLQRHTAGRATKCFGSSNASWYPVPWLRAAAPISGLPVGEPTEKAFWTDIPSDSRRISESEKISFSTWNIS